MAVFFYFKGGIFTNKRIQLLAGGVLALLAVACYCHEPEELQNEEDDIELKPKAAVLTVRGAKLAAKDVNPRDPFHAEHFNEEQLKLLVSAEKGKINSEVNNVSADKMKMAAQVELAEDGTSPVNQDRKNNKNKNSNEKHNDKTDSNSNILELTGIILSDDMKIALLHYQGQQFALDLGESRNNVTLVYLDDVSAVVIVNKEKQVLNLK